MKIAVKRLIRDEKGQTMILALILLLVGGLIVTPLLAFMSTGLIAGEVYEKRAAELYAADAGVEDAVWKIQHQVDEVQELSCGSSNHTWSYDISDVNGKSVAVTLTWVNNGTYHVVSTATGDGSGTEIEAHITGASVYGDYAGILDNVITSPCDYVLQGPTTVEPPEGEEHGPEANYEGDWPTAEDLSAWYWEDVKDEDPYDSDTLDVKNYVATGFGPLYRNGTLSIQNTGTAGLEVKLEGTVYITGDTLIGTTDKAFTLDLNGQAIFVESASGAAPEDDPCNPGNDYALRFGTKCTLKGSGCIIAVGNIEFKPNLASTPGDYIFVLSINGKTYMQPNGDFYGTLAGSSEVYIQNGQAHWVDSSTVEGGVGFPTLLETGLAYGIASWDIKDTSQQ
jgi:hypothetical protein